MTSPSWAESQSQKWGRPVTVITNGCDGRIQAGAGRRDGFELFHLGTLYPDRHDLSSVWRAIREQSARGTPTVDRICLIGEPQPAVREELTVAGLTPRLEVTGFLPSSDALGRMAQADALLLAGPRDASGLLRGWIPGEAVRVPRDGFAHPLRR